MPKPTKGPRLGGSAAHQRLILRNLATSLFEHGAITTTESRARALRPYAEKLITKAKKGGLHNRRLVLRELYPSVDWKLFNDEGVQVVNKYPQHRLFTEIAESFADRPGGYTRITKIGPRKGDNAPMAVISLVTEAYAPSAPKATKAAPAAVAVEEPAAEETPVEETAVEDAPTELAEEASPETSVVAEEEVAEEPTESAKTTEKDEQA